MKKEERISYWRDIVKQQEESGVEATVFCRDHDLKLSQFYRWRRRFRNPQTGNGSSAFLQLIPISKQKRSGVCVHLNNGLRIEVELGFDPHTLRSVMEAVRGQ